METEEKLGERKENKTREGRLAWMFVTFGKIILQDGSRNY